MKSFILLFSILILFTEIINAQVDFEKYFKNKTMRVDFIQAGNRNESHFFLNKIKEEPFWGGSHKNLVDTFMYGDYVFEVYDKKENKLLYSRGFSTIFREWQETNEAYDFNKSFLTSIVFPFPNDSITLKVKSRDIHNKWHLEFNVNIDPRSLFIKKGQPYSFKTAKVFDSGNPNQKLDIAIIAEGYTQTEMEKFSKDVQKFLRELSKTAPFTSHLDKINIWQINSISDTSGTDFPRKNDWRNTILDSHFDTFGSERYLTTQSIEKIRDVAALVPYDQIYILVNTTKYGGGGVYNYYNLTSSDNELSGFVFIHEFGHGFAGLADEYGYQGQSEDIRYDYNVEIAAPNLTTLVEFDKKWKDLVDKDTPVPTPANNKYKDKIGAFEGGGYVTKKVYRPCYDCIMRTAGAKEFCPVCKRAIVQMLEFYSE